MQCWDKQGFLDIVQKATTTKENFGKWDLIKIKTSAHQKMSLTHRHREQTCGCQGGGAVGEGWIGSLGLADANYYIQNRYTTRSYCRAQGIIFNIL